jgi:hypothetical protein
LEENLVLVACEGAFQFELGSRVCHVASEDHVPEGCVIKIVDVAVCLSPAEVVPVIDSLVCWK